MFQACDRLDGRFAARFLEKIGDDAVALIHGKRAADQPIGDKGVGLIFCY